MRVARDVQLVENVTRLHAAERLLGEAKFIAAQPHVRFGTAITVTAPTDISSVMACVKRAESGDYNEHSHISDGSGAFQVVPRTWRSLSSLAGYPGYAYAYLAPPAVQDAVVAWALTHGKAGNWSPKYGADSCTVGIGG